MAFENADGSPVHRRSLTVPIHAPVKAGKSDQAIADIRMITAEHRLPVAQRLTVFPLDINNATLPPQILRLTVEARRTLDIL